MKKEFLDFLYDQRSVVQKEIDNLVEEGKQPTPSEMAICSGSFKLELEAKRKHIQSINQAIQKYLDLHK